VAPSFQHCGGAIDELLDQEREHARSELVEGARGLELSIAKLEAVVSALELALNAQGQQRGIAA
jgi:hypothetical protein